MYFWAWRGGVVGGVWGEGGGGGGVVGICWLFNCHRSTEVTRAMTAYIGYLRAR